MTQKHRLLQKQAQKVLMGLAESREAFDAGELRFFQERLRSSQTWRLVPSIDPKTFAYLDIETTGLGFPPEASSTTIAVMINGELFVEHEREAKRELLERLESDAKMVVTFNGLSFDLPFLRREFGLELKLPHIDLRVWLRRHGLKGGLKAIQLECADRVHQRSSMDIDGFDAVRLWRMHERGVPRALETLMTYNAEDSVCLQPLLELAFEKEMELAPWLGLSPLKPMPPLAKITTVVDPFVYGLLRGEESWNVPEGW